MKCMCTQTRPWFILSSERVFGGMEFEPMLTPRDKSPLLENVPRRIMNDDDGDDDDDGDEGVARNGDVLYHKESR